MRQRQAKSGTSASQSSAEAAVAGGGGHSNITDQIHVHNHNHNHKRRIKNGSSGNGNGNSNDDLRRILPFVVILVTLVVSIQLVVNSMLYGNENRSGNGNGNGNGSGNQGFLTTDANNLRRRNPIGPGDESTGRRLDNSYDNLLKNTIRYDLPRSNDNDNNNNDNNNNRGGNPENLALLRGEIDNLRSQIRQLESKSQKYVDDPRFFPFVIRDSRHLTPVQVDPDFHVFDYVDLNQAQQPKSVHAQLLHNARIVVDEELEARRREAASATGTANANAKETRRKKSGPPEKYEAPCQKYSLECYRQKILQVFSYVLRKFPSVEYYFYVEADNDLCVPMTMVKDLALNERRYFINTGIGFSGWIMSREFMGDFLRLYGNSTLNKATTKIDPLTNKTVAVPPEIRPDVLASYYLTDKRAWTVTRQYWVSHTTLESLGMASLTVPDRRTNETGKRLKLDKHLPRCLEPRRAKWKVSRRKPYLDPRDVFGWDYFDYEVCPDSLLFPCGGPEQLQKLVLDDYRVANETGAIAHEQLVAEKRRLRQAAQAAAAAEKAKTNAKASATGQAKPELTLVQDKANQLLDRRIQLAMGRHE